MRALNHVCGASLVCGARLSQRLVPHLALSVGILGLSMLGITRPAWADIVPGSDPDVEPPPAPAPIVIVNNDPKDQPSSDPTSDPTTTSPSRSFVRGFAAVGASNGGVFGIRSSALHLGAGLTVDHRSIGSETGIAVPISIEVDTGESPSGLKLTEAALTFGLQGVIGRVRIGGGLSLSHLWISRPSVNRTIGALGAGAFVLASVDVLKFDSDRAIFVGARPSVDWRWGEMDISDGAPAWRVAGVIGARF